MTTSEFNTEAGCKPVNTYRANKKTQKRTLEVITEKPGWPLTWHIICELLGT